MFEDARHTPDSYRYTVSFVSYSRLRVSDRGPVVPLHFLGNTVGLLRSETQRVSGETGNGAIMVFVYSNSKLILSLFNRRRNNTMSCVFKAKLTFPSTLRA